MRLCSPYNLSLNPVLRYTMDIRPLSDGLSRPRVHNAPNDIPNATRVVGVKLFNIAHINIGCCERRF